MLKVRKAGVRTPCLYQLDSANTKITMEKIDGVTAKIFLLECLESKTVGFGEKLAFVRSLFSEYLFKHC